MMNLGKTLYLFELKFICVVLYTWQRGQFSKFMPSIAQMYFMLQSKLINYLFQVEVLSCNEGVRN